MKCEICEKHAVFDEKPLCKDHFIEHFEKKTDETIEQYNLFTKDEKIVVAVSGGKDSMSLLHYLKKKGYVVEALAIDEGIAGYRENTLDFLKSYCTEHNIPLRIDSFEKETGLPLDKSKPEGQPACNLCGTLRRHLLEKNAKGYDKIATAHNLDDESQAVLMNILKSQTSLMFRQGPITKKVEGMTQKVKPFYFQKEKEIMIYAFINNLAVDFEECPYAPLSFRAQVREKLNLLETKKPGTKLNIVAHYLDLREECATEDEGLTKCSVCNQPASSTICRACRAKKEIRENIHRKTALK